MKLREKCNIYLGIIGAIAVMLIIILYLVVNPVLRTTGVTSIAQDLLKKFLSVGILIIVCELAIIFSASTFFCKFIINRIRELINYLQAAADGEVLELIKDRYRDEITELGQLMVEVFQRMSTSRFELESNFQQLAATNKKLETSYIQSYNLQLIQEEISRELEIDQLVKKTADIIMGLFGSKRCLIYMADEESEALNALAYSGSVVKGDPKKTIAFNSDNMVARSWRNKTIFTEEDAKPNELAQLHKRNINSVLTVPLIGRQGTVGIMVIEHELAKGISEEIVNFARVVAQELSLSVENAYLYDKMRRMAIRDALTGVYNRLHLMTYKAEIFANNPQKVSVLIFDMDHFKRINDKFGHLSGDMVLKTTANLIQKMLPCGILARYGGEEFVIVLPDVSEEEAFKFADSIRQIISHHQFLVSNEKPISVTLSVGVACYPLVSNSYEGLLQLADEALYEAKNTGRNKVCVAAPKDKNGSK